MSNPCLEYVTAEIEKVGLPYAVEHGGKHLKVRYGKDLCHTHILAATPSDWRAPMNERAQIRRSLAALGYGHIDEEPAVDVLVTLHNGEPGVASYDLAKRFSKQHKDVLRAIDGVLTIEHEIEPDFNRRNFTPIEYQDQKGRTHRAFMLTERAFSVLAMGFTGEDAIKWKVKYSRAFEAMRAEIERIHPTANLNEGEFVRREEMDAMLSMFSELELRQLPAPVKKAAFVPRSLLRRRQERVSKRRDGDRRSDWRMAH